jgi:NAD(P)-dependent dehydrogenase (short-subunit alcohol dehydrogenase family)
MRCSHEDKTAIVTGAAGGLGRAVAIAIARTAAEVFLVDRNLEGLAQTHRLIREAGGHAHVHAADLSDPNACRQAVEAGQAAMGGIDSLCNVAGVIFFAHATEMTAEPWHKTLAINLSAPFFLCQAAIPGLIARRGAIVNVASAAAFVGQAYVAANAASKAGLAHLTGSLAMEYVHAPIRINAVAPGGMATPMGATVSMPEGIDMALVERFSGMRGFVEVAEVADMIRYLASDAAQGFHGAVINLDAGITAG